MNGPRSEWEDAAPTNISPRIVENIDRVLKSVRSYLGMDVAFLSEFLGTSRVFRSVDSARPDTPIKVGGVISMAQGYCQHIVDGRLPELIPDTAKVPLARALPETHSIPIGAHISVPVRLEDGSVFGTFCCFAHKPHHELGERDLDLMRTFSGLIANQIAADIDEDRERARNNEMIRDAVREGDPQILFQPIYRLADLKIAGVEALSRFMSEPRRSPDLWFADAEEAGMGAALELLAVRKAIAAAAALPPSLAINLNISPKTLISAKVAESLTGIDPKRIVIEITEHTPIPDYEPLLAVLRPAARHRHARRHRRRRRRLLEPSACPQARARHHQARRQPHPRYRPRSDAPRHGGGTRRVRPPHRQPDRRRGHRDASRSSRPCASSRSRRVRVSTSAIPSPPPRSPRSSSAGSPPTSN